MQSFRRTILKSAAAAVVLAAASFQPALAAVDVAGVKFDDTATVAGQTLKLNGAGLRTKVIFKVYALGLYLQDKKTNVADVLAAPGARRVHIVVLRELTSEEFGKAFMAGLNDNTDAAERAKIVPQTKQFGEMFASFPGLKKGDALTVDWIPGSGTQCFLNGKPIGPVLPDQAFYNAILRIWIGDKPVDSSLKPQLLGEK
ncbi:lipoprotein transmembrane [Duganella sp. FT92W]|uniref:Lipoprotein transmembrane n=1 Tax=Pseudoduganella rivuli TaxID=2666085 RepID=A0A7X2IJ71_9BURK|nr:chalcone isomerase family protein [Pseudoduganella rivuli]MRV70811.1 lipoprotein transmembrane [Pseudoduganella rivuli]